ncbi:MAG: alkyl hydroperoxide reductase [Chloroflexota bacterium]
MHVIPQLRDLEERFPNHLLIIGVHSAKYTAEGRDEHLRHAIQRLGISHPVVNDREMAVWQGYAVRAWPTLMFLSPDGRVLARHEGEFDLDAMTEALSGMIEELEAEHTFTRAHPYQPHLAPDGDNLLRYPMGLYASESSLFVADTGHDRILEIALDGCIRRIIGTGEAGFSDGPAEAARFRVPHGLDVAGRTLYVADAGNHAIRSVDLRSGVVSTIAGTGENAQSYLSRGSALETPLRSPWDLVLVEDVLYIAMAGNHQIWMHRPGTSEISRYAGTGHEGRRDGTVRSAWFAQPVGINHFHSSLVVCDAETSAVRTVARTGDDGGDVVTLTGQDLFDWGDIDGRLADALLQHPAGVVTDSATGLIYVADSYNNKIKCLDPDGGVIQTIAGTGATGHVDGSGPAAEFFEPYSLALAADALYVADTNNHAIRRINIESHEVTTLDIQVDR